MLLTELSFLIILKGLKDLLLFINNQDHTLEAVNVALLYLFWIVDAYIVAVI